MNFAVGPASTLRWCQLQTERMEYSALGCSNAGAAVSFSYGDLHCLPLGSGVWVGYCWSGSYWECGRPQGGEVAPGAVWKVLSATFRPEP